MHVFGGSQNGIDRTGLDAERAADAGLLIDYGDQRHIEMLAVFGIEFQHLGVEQVGECDDGRLSTGRALIDRRLAIGDGFGVGPAAWKSALPTLGLRQQGVDLIDDRIALDLKPYCGVTEYQAK